MDGFRKQCSPLVIRANAYAGKKKLPEVLAAVISVLDVIVVVVVVVGVVGTKKV